MSQRIFLTAFVSLALLAGQAAANSTTVSVRPSSTTAPSLQQILDALVVSGPAIDAAAPDNIELWLNSAGPLTARIAANFTGKDKVTFGIYDPDHPTSGAFLLGDLARDVATVSFNEDDSISIHSGLQRKGFGFDGPFGFFVKESRKKQSPVFLFTEADLNGDIVKAKVFQGNDLTMLKLPGQRPGLFLNSQYLIAFETGSGDKSGGFNDFVVLVSGILPVPEPAMLGLLAISLAVMFGRRGHAT